MDKVRFQSQERLDKVDADALQELVYGYLSEALGGLMGNAGGALTTIEYTVSESSGSYYLNLGPFQWYHSQPNGVTSITEFDGTTRSVPKRFEGQVVTYNPADEGQAELVDWTASHNLFNLSATVAEQQDSTKVGVIGAPLVGGAVHNPFLWARPATIDTDTDARREWNVAAGDEVAISIKTRTRTISEFRFSTTRPVVSSSDTNQNQWVPIARTIAWDFSGGTTNAAGAAVPSSPYLVPLYVWDHVASYGDYEQQNSLEGSNQGAVGTGVSRYTTDDGSASGASFPGVADANLFHEIPPFEHDGAGISPLARGRWLPAGGNAAPGVGNPTSAYGASAQGVSYPYLGWYDDNGYVPGSDGTDYSGKGWKALSAQGFDESVAPWRLGIPQTLYMMRRVMASMQSSGGDRPWYAYPNGGGLVELRQQIDTVAAGYVEADTEQVGSPNGSVLNIIASGRIAQDYAGSTKSFSGAGNLIKVTEGLTSSGNYSVWEIGPKHTVSSVLLGNLAHGDNTSGTVGFGLTHPGAAGGIGGASGLPLIGWTWVTRGDLAGANLTSRFTLWSSSYKSGYQGPSSASTSLETISLDLKPFGGPPGAGFGYRLYTEGQQTAPSYVYFPPTTADTSFGADFRMGVHWDKPWDQSQSVQQTFITVIGEAV